jgi:nanoRNase/pAp phosphatase (c-di-AMP/oligoRNAs hydrolase)
METGEAVRMAQEIVREASHVLVVAHKNPDPDALAAAFGMRSLLESFGPKAVIGYSGIIGRAENRAMVRQLGIPVHPIDMLHTEEFDVVAVVDAQPGGGNVPEEAASRADIVVDHHPQREGLVARMVDVREEYGATSTIVTAYLQAAGVEWGEPLATALYYGIKTDIGDLSRNSTWADHEAMRILFPSVSNTLLTSIERPRVPPSYFLTLRDAIAGARVHEDVLVCDLGDVGTPDLVAEMADTFLRLRGIRWTLCMGEYKENLHFSLRALEHGSIAGPLAERLLDGLGSGGGHDRAAAGMVPVPEGAGGRRELRERIVGRFLREVGRGGAEGRPLPRGEP